jgi:hypothetical protein
VGAAGRLNRRVIVASAATWLIGPLDDVVVVALAFRYAARQVPREVLFEAWPAEPRILERLLPRPSD